jgi:hypothetical protein
MNTSKNMTMKISTIPTSVWTCVIINMISAAVRSELLDLQN